MGSIVVQVIETDDKETALCFNGTVVAGINPRRKPFIVIHSFNVNDEDLLEFGYIAQEE